MANEQKVKLVVNQTLPPQGRNLVKVYGWSEDGGDLPEYDENDDGKSLTVVKQEDDTVTLEWAEGGFPLADRMAKGTKEGSVVIGDIEDGKATGEYAFAEGVESEAKGGGSHAEGQATLAKGNYSHTEGSHTIASSHIQHVQGKYNVEDTLNTFADIIGNGANADDRKNIEATSWGGNKYLAGDVYIHCENNSSGGEKLIAIPEPPDDSNNYKLVCRAGEISWIAE